jgi:hypothetical protein
MFQAKTSREMGFRLRGNDGMFQAKTSREMGSAFAGMTE